MLSGTRRRRRQTHHHLALVVALVLSTLAGTPALASAAAPLRLPRTAQPGASVDVMPSPARGGLTAKALMALPAYASVGGRRVATLATRTRYTHAGVRLLVTAGRWDAGGGLWLHVVVPLRPTGRQLWVRADQVAVTPTPYFVPVGRRTRTLTVRRAGRIVGRWRVVVGTATTPTPDGLAAVYEEVQAADPSDFTGPWALHLTAFSRALDRYGAGDGRIAIHGRGPAALVDPLGSARSHGCVRVDNAVVQRLQHLLPLGTPVLIR